VGLQITYWINFVSPLDYLSTAQNILSRSCGENLKKHKVPPKWQSQCTRYKTIQDSMVATFQMSNHFHPFHDDASLKPFQFPNAKGFKRNGSHLPNLSKPPFWGFHIIFFLGRMLQAFPPPQREKKTHTQTACISAAPTNAAISSEASPSCCAAKDAKDALSLSPMVGTSPKDLPPPSRSIAITRANKNTSFQADLGEAMWGFRLFRFPGIFPQQRLKIIFTLLKGF